MNSKNLTINGVKVALALLTKKGENDSYYGIDANSVSSHEELIKVIGGEAVVASWLVQQLNLRLQKVQCTYKINLDSEDFTKFVSNDWRKNRRDEEGARITELQKQIREYKKAGDKAKATELFEELKSLMFGDDDSE